MNLDASSHRAFEVALQCALHTCAQRATARRRALYQSRARCWPSPLSGQWHWQTPTRRISFTLPGFGSQNRHGRRPGCAHGGQRHSESERGRLVNGMRCASRGLDPSRPQCDDGRTQVRVRHRVRPERALAASRGQVPVAGGRVRVLFAAQLASDRGRHHRDSDAGSNAGRGSPPPQTLSQGHWHEKSVSCNLALVASLPLAVDRDSDHRLRALLGASFVHWPGQLEWHRPALALRSIRASCSSLFW